MIVRNEAPRILRCLRSVTPHVSSYAILDTGSTDGTSELIRAHFTEAAVPGEVASGTFVDFAQARNDALALARMHGDAWDYLLLIDGDMELVVDRPGAIQGLVERVYEIDQRTSASTYPNPRLVHTSVAARYILPTHEYLDTANVPFHPLPGVWIRDHDDGASHAVKYERDERLLREFHAKNPDDARCIFYLAQTLECIGGQEALEESAALYERRAGLGGFAAEAWHARLMVARVRQRLDDPRFIADALRAHQERPERAEPIHLLASHYRKRGETTLALLFWRAGKDIPLPVGEELFVEHGIYDWGFDEEVSISGGYARDAETRDVARRACFRLSTLRSAPYTTRSDAAKNSVYYAKTAAEVFGESAIVRTLDTRPTSRENGWAPMNPSICIDVHGKVRCTLRLVNYIYGSYAIRNDEGCIRTRNLLLDLDDDLSVVGSREAVDQSSVLRSPRAIVRGLEDLRLFAWRGQLWASCTVLDRNDDARAEIALVSFDSRGDVFEIYPLRGYQSHLHQKNWCPLVVGEDLFFVYSAEPLTVLKVDSAKLDVALHAVKDNGPLSLEYLRGGSQVLPFDGGYLYVAHEAHDYDDQYGQRRRYLHRFVQLDSSFAVVALSEPFVIRELGVEFVAGMIRHGDRLVLSFGAKDETAWVLSVKESAVRRSLRTADDWCSKGGAK